MEQSSDSRRKAWTIHWAPLRVWATHFWVFALLLTAAFQPAEPATPKRVRSPVPVTTIVRSSGPAVVLIIAKNRRGSVQATGFIVSPDGIVVTNYHVIAGATDVQVKLTNGSVFSAVGIIGLDEERDLALVKIVAPPLPFVKLGNSDDLEPGERVVAIGNPGGLENTVADGLVSSIRVLERGTKVIQTTTPASLGSSGSPLFNLQGEVVGVTTFKIVRGENLNFAVAANHLAKIPLMDQPIPFAGPLIQVPWSSSQAGGAVPPRPGAKSEEVYKAALGAYLKGNYAMAVIGFQTYLSLFPNTPLVPDAYYWKGESYYNQRNYLNAIQDFGSVIISYPNSPLVPSAMLKQGYAFLELGETSRGEAALWDVITQFGDSQEAQRAQERLRKAQGLW